MVGIVILNYNNATLTIDCIESIVKYNTYPIRIVVVDNASSDSSVDVLNQYLMSHEGLFKLLVSNKNGGYAQGNNFGLKYLEQIEDVSEVMILNNDILFTEDIIPRLVDFINTHPEAGLVSPLLYCRDGKTIDSSCARRDCSVYEIIWSYFLYFTDICGIISHFRRKSKVLEQNPSLIEQSQIEIELPSGSCMMIKKDVFKEIDYFDPNTFLYYEENILYRKLKRIGKTNYLVPSISCIHLGGKTTNKVAHSAAFMRNSKNSASYYAANYMNLSFFQRFLLGLSTKWFNSWVTIIKLFKHDK